MQRGSDNACEQTDDAWEAAWIIGPHQKCVQQAYYMSALCLHQVGKYSEALKYLAPFSVKYRVHPGIWMATNASKVKHGKFGK